MTLTGGQRNDVTQLIPLIDAVRPIGGRIGRPRKRPVVVLADRSYDHDKYRRLVRQRGITPIIARRGVERAFAHLHWFHWLRIHWDRHP